MPMGEFCIRGSRQFDVNSGNGTFRVFVYRPTSRPPADGFPVIYGLDGNAHFTSLITSMKAHSVRPELTGLGPAVVVGIGYPIEDDHDLDRRTFDYSPDADPSWLGERPDGLPWPEVGGAEAFLSFLEDRIKPEIAASESIDPERQSLFGHSFGGLCTLYAALTRPQAFRHFLVSSPSIWYAEKRILSFIDGFANRLSTVQERRDLFLSIGALEQTVPPFLDERWPAYAQWIRRNNMVGNIRALHQTLAQMSLPLLDLKFHEFEGEHHGSVPPVSINMAMKIALKPARSGRVP